jgi:hypothetical protein
VLLTYAKPFQTETTDFTAYTEYILIWLTLEPFQSPLIASLYSSELNNKNGQLLPGAKQF